jgi:hypothetical protein
VRALEPLVGIRVVAEPASLDRAHWTSWAGIDRTIVLRTAPDEAFAIDAASVVVDDPFAIVEPESSFSGRWLTAAELAASVLPHLEWELPSIRPALAQGLIAGVPAKLWLAEDGALLVTATAYAHELEERLG